MDRLPFEPIVQAFLHVADSVTRRCLPMEGAVAPEGDPCRHCKRQLQRWFNYYKDQLKAEYQRIRHYFPGPDQFAAPGDLAQLLAEVLLAALTAAVLAALVARLPPALLQQAFQAVRAARPALLAALTALAAAFLGRGRTAEASLEELADRLEGSEEFEALALQEAEKILEELVPPPALRCPELETMVREAIDRLQTCSDSESERASCCEHASLVVEGVSEELSTLERAYGDSPSYSSSCGATADLLARLRELHAARC